MGSWNFQIIFSRPLLTIIFKLNNDYFKTRDFSSLIKRVITDVINVTSVQSEVLMSKKSVLGVVDFYGLSNNLLKRALRRGFGCLS